MVDTRNVALSGREKRKDLYNPVGNSSAVNHTTSGMNSMFVGTSSERNLPLLKQSSNVVSSSINDGSDSSDRLIRFEDKDRSCGDVFESSSSENEDRDNDDLKMEEES